jgi:hypothetical protein
MAYRGAKRLEMVCGVSSAQTYLLAFSVTGWEKELFREDEMNELFVKKLPIQETTTYKELVAELKKMGLHVFHERIV